MGESAALLPVRGKGRKMKKILIIASSLLIVSGAASADEYSGSFWQNTSKSSPSESANRPFANDPMDPLWFGARGTVLTSVTGMIHRNSLEITPGVQFSVNDVTALYLNAGGLYSFKDPKSNDSGIYLGSIHVSGLDLGAIYRLSDGNRISDVIAGIRTGRSASEIDWYQETIWKVGFRFGTVRNRITLAMEVNTNWVFDDNQGHAWINFIPQAYARLAENFGMGLSVDFRKDTNQLHGYDDVRVGGLFTHRVGATSYAGGLGYRTNSNAFDLSVKVAVLF